MINTSTIKDKGKRSKEMRKLIHSLAGFDLEEGYKRQPFCLRTALTIMHELSDPVCIFWGNDLSSYYNDSFIPFLGTVHPQALGTPVEICNPGLWQLIGENLKKGLLGDEGEQNNVKWPIPIFGFNSNPRFILSFTPLPDEGGIISGVMLTITEDIDSTQNDENKFRTLLMHSPMAMVVLKEPGHVVDIINEAMLNNIWDKELQDVQGKKLVDIFPDIINQKFPELLEQVYTSGQSYKESEALILRKNKGILTKHYVDFEYAPLKNAAGEIEAIIATVADVTNRVEERRKTEDAEERLRLAAEATGLATWDLNLKTREMISSSKLSEIFGEDPLKQLTHPDVRSKIHPDDIHTIVEAAFEEAMTTGTYLYEARVVWQDNSVHWIKTMGKVLYDKHGLPDRMLGTIVDITEQVQSRKLLQDSETRFRSLVKGLPFAVYMCNEHGYLEFYNDAAVTLWGREPEPGNQLWCGSYSIFDLQGNPVSVENSHTAKCFRAGKPLTGEALIERPDGERRHVLSNPQPLYNASGQLTGVMNAVIDITDTKRAERILIENEQRFRTVANTAPVMIWMAGIDKLCYFCNTGWLKYTGRTMEQEAGNGWVEGIHPDDLEDCSKIYEEAFRTYQPFYIEYRLRRHDGAYRWVYDNGVPRFNENGTFEGFIGSCLDIHDQKQSAGKLENLVEERTHNLRIANIALERSNEELEQFAFVTSHDLQEPLRKINTFAHMLYEKNKDALSDDAKTYLDKITLSAQRMSRLINDLLNFSRLNRSDEKFSDVDLNELLDNIRNDFELMINQKNAVVIYKELPVIKAIPLQMNQLLYNLLGNSLKFTAPGRQPVIHITSRELPAAEVTKHSGLNPALPYCEIKVSDNGIGFKQEYAQKIFEIFQRLNGKSEYEGTGIGLALCNKIVLNHNGLIFANSEEDRGTDFHIFLPIKQ